jgi:hypothetical protein
LARCQTIRQFLEYNPTLSTILSVAQIDKTVAETHHNRGCILAEMNRPGEALEHQLIFNKMLLEELEGNPATDMRLSMSFNELGVAYMINDGKFIDSPATSLMLILIFTDWARGEECFRRSIDEMQRLEDFKRYKISLPLVNLAYCHSLSGRYEEAEALFIQGLADRVDQFGQNDEESFM